MLTWRKFKFFQVWVYMFGLRLVLQFRFKVIGFKFFLDEFVFTFFAVH